MGATYTRQSTITDGNVATAADVNDEYNQLVSAFEASTGHSHDGTAAEGGYVGILADNDKHNYVTFNGDIVEFWIDSDGAGNPELQFSLSNGVITPAVDDDIDLGSATKKFKDLFIGGTATMDAIVFTSGTAITSVDTDLSSVSTSDDTLASSKAIKAYIDSGTSTLINKVINVDDNTVSNVEVDNFKATAVVTEAEGLSSSNNDTSIPTTAAVIDYVDTHKADTSTHGVSELVGTTETQTLTNKDIAATNLDLATLAQTLTGPSNVVGQVSANIADDFDPAWRDKMAHTSWEQANGKIPTRPIFTASTSYIYIHDGNTGDLWASYDMAGVTVSSIEYTNGRLLIGTTTGLIIWKYALDENIGSTTIQYSSSTSPALIGDHVASVRISIQANAPLEAAGLPTPTILVTMVGGASIIHNDNTVADITSNIGTLNYSYHGTFLADGGVAIPLHQSNGKNAVLNVFDTLPTADTIITSGSKTGTGADVDRLYSLYQEAGVGDCDIPLWNTLSNLIELRSVEVAGNKLIVGTPLGKCIIEENPTTPTLGSVQYIDSVFNAGPIVGDAEVVLTGDSLTDRSVTGRAITDNGSATFTVANGGELKYTTASGGTITAGVTTGGECYGWELIGATWIFREALADWVGVAEAAGVLTIADGTKFMKLAYINGSAPSAEQLESIQSTGIAALVSGTALFLPYNETVLDTKYDEKRDIYIVPQASGYSEWQNGIRIDSTASNVGTLTDVASNDGVVAQGGATAYLEAPARNLGDELAKSNQKISELTNKPDPYTLVGSSTTTVVLPRGYRAVSGSVIISGSSLLHEGLANDWTQNTDGYIWTVAFGSAQTGNISIPMEVA